MTTVKSKNLKKDSDNVMVSFQVSNEMHDKILELSSKEDRSKSNWLKHIISKEIENNKK